MRDRTISTARVIIATSMLGSSRLCAATIEGRNGRWMKPVGIASARSSRAWSVV